MIKYIYLFVAILFFGQSAEAQHQDHVWIFGESAGIDFSSGTPVAFTGNSMSAGEGGASVSDEFGQLYFYTNGITVWNKNHVPMTNGTGLTGHLSATNSAVIIPIPSSSSQYYVFTTGAADNNFADGLNYSIVDMCQEGGLGAVTEKNTVLANLMSEKLAVIKDKNSATIWLVAHKMFSNEFYSYKITSGGINTTPIISEVGVSLATADAARGEMKASQSGSKIAMPYRPDRSIYLFDFDQATGIVSNPVSWNFSQGGLLYGAEFSPDEQKLYATRYGTGGGAAVHQFDISSGDPAIISASGLIVGTSSSEHMASLKLGPDGKIYIARQEFYGTGGGAANGGSTHLAIINSPNTLGMGCNFVDDGIYLEGGRSRFGLPPSVTIFPASYGDAQITSSSGCLGTPSNFSITFNSTTPASVVWNFGDPVSGLNNTSTDLNPSHIYQQPGTYTVTATYTINCKPTYVSTTLTISSGLSINLGDEKFICEGSTVTLSPNLPPETTYSWSTGSTNPSITISEPGLYWVFADNGTCTNYDSVNIILQQIPTISLSSDTTLCAGEEIEVSVPANAGQSFSWSTGSTANSITISQAGTYTLEISQNGCRAEKSIEVLEGVCDFFVPNVFTPNNDNVNDNFAIRGLRGGSWELKIFNRYGAQIYKTENYQNNWNGGSAPDGVYYYYLINTRTSKSYKGFVEIIK